MTGEMRSDLFSILLVGLVVPSKFRTLHTSKHDADDLVEFVGEDEANS
jgi:hypothetical protein